MNLLATAVIKAGLLTKGQIEEFKRWKTPVEIPEGIPDKAPSLEEASMVIQEALQSEGYVLTRETDLEILHQYLRTQTSGVLHVEVMTDDPTGESKADIPVTYGVTPLGEFVIPWKSESIKEEMDNGMTHLVTSSGPVWFKDVRELFFGEQKSFMVCIPRAPGEDHGGVS